MNCKRKNVTVEESDEGGKKQDDNKARRRRLLSVEPAARRFAVEAPARFRLSHPPGQMTPIPSGGDGQGWSARAAMISHLGWTVTAREIAAARRRLWPCGMHCTEPGGGEVVPAGGGGSFQVDELGRRSKFRRARHARFPTERAGPGERWRLVPRAAEPVSSSSGLLPRRRLRFEPLWVGSLCLSNGGGLS